MSGFVALKAAYVVTWIIGLLYLRYLLGRYRRVRSEIKALKQSA
jgi:hypothetical protein